MRISEWICNRIMMKKKYRFFDPFTGEAPLNCNLTDKTDDRLKEVLIGL